MKLIDLHALRFAEPVWLWLLVAPTVLFCLWTAQVVRRRIDARRLTRHRLVPVRERYPRLGHLAFWLWALVALAATIVALARPQMPLSIVRTNGVDIVVLQDASASMRVADVAGNRWQRSMAWLRTFGESLGWQGDRVALAVFAKIAAPQIRLTRDPHTLFFFLEHLSSEPPFRLDDEATWDTNIEEGIYWGFHLVDKDEELYGRTSNPRAFVVISDGQAWTGDVRNALDLTVERGIPVYVIGVGTTEGGLIPPGPARPGEMSKPSTLRSALDRRSLRQIALAGRGTYFELDRQSDREIAVGIIDAVRAGGGNQTAERVEDLYWHCLLAAAAFLGIATFTTRDRAALWWQAGGALVALLVMFTLVR